MRSRRRGDGGGIITTTVSLRSPDQTVSLTMCLHRQRDSPFRARKVSVAKIQRRMKCVINLNLCWAELEERYRDRTSSKVLSMEADTEQLQNDINENIERLARMSPPAGPSL